MLLSLHVGILMQSLVRFLSQASVDTFRRLAEDADTGMRRSIHTFAFCVPTLLMSHQYQIKISRNVNCDHGRQFLTIIPKIFIFIRYQYVLGNFHNILLRDAH